MAVAAAGRAGGSALVPAPVDLPAISAVFWNTELSPQFCPPPAPIFLMPVQKNGPLLVYSLSTPRLERRFLKYPPFAAVSPTFFGQTVTLLCTFV